jgi:PAS domain S-box-containing protein
VGLSRIAAPLIAQNQVVGYLYADLDALYGSFNEVDRDMLGMLASQGATALENARLVEGLEQRVTERTTALEQRAAELAIINSVGEAMTKNLDVPTVVRIVGDRVREIFQADVVTITMYDQPSQSIEWAYGYDRGYLDPLPPTRPLGTGLGSQIIATRLPLRFGTAAESDAAGALTVPDATGNTDSTQSYVGVPIIAGERVLGVVTIQSYQPNVYTADSVSLLQTLSSNMGVAIENARLFSETRRLLDETQQRNAELAVLNSVQAGLAAKLELTGIIELVGDKVREIFGGSDMSIRLFDWPTDTMSFPYFVERGKRLTIEPYVPPQGFGRHILQTRQPLRLSSLVDLATLYQTLGLTGTTVVPGTENAESFLGVPILSGDEAIGLITLESFTPHAFTEADERLLTTLAGSMSVALENARLFGETTRLLGETEQRASELAIINSVQQGLAAQLDFQAIIDLVGDRLAEILHSRDLGIRLFDHEQGLVIFPYEFEHGQRLNIEPRQPGAVARHILDTGQPLLLASTAQWLASTEPAEKSIPGTDESLSSIAVPIPGRDRPMGFVMLENYERENAFSLSDQRLLTTLAASLSVALENARLFGETRRLLGETEQRASELAIINSVQAGLAAKLDLTGIIELVGEKVREIFHGADTSIRLYDPKTDLMSFPYVVERGKRLDVEPIIPPQGFGRYILETRQPVLLNGNADLTKYGFLPDLTTVPGTESAESFLGVPILAGKVAIGLIGLESFETNAFTESDQRLLMTLAGSLSVALENARLFDETQRLLTETEQRAAELAVINSVQSGLVAQSDFQGVIELVGNKLLEVLGNDNIGIRLYDRETNLVHYPFEVENDQRLTIAPVPVREGGMPQRVLNSREPIVINAGLDAYYESGVLRLLPGTEMAKAMLAVPFRARGETTGYIITENLKRENAFSESDVRLLTTVAGSLGVALDNARLYQEIKRRAQETAALAEVGREISGSLDTGTVLERIATRAKELLGGDTSAVFLPDEQSGGQVFRSTVAVGLVAEEIKADAIRLGEGIIGGLAAEGKAEYINDTSIDARAVHIPGTPADKADERLMAAPLLIRERVSGMLAVWRTGGEPFNDNELSFLVGLARQAAVAIENARLFAEAERRAAETAALAEVGREISASLDLPTVLERIATRAKERLRARDVTLRLLEGDNRLPVVVALGQYAEQQKALVIRLGQGITGSVAQSGQPEIVNHPLSDPRIIHVPGTEQDEEREAVIFAPLLLRDRVAGVLTLWRDKPSSGEFTQSDLDFAVGLARQAAVAIENARLYEQRAAAELEMQRQKQYLEGVLQNSPVAIVTVDRDFQVVSWNPAAESLFGYTAAEAIGQNIYQLHSKDSDILEESRHYGEIIASGERVQAITQRTRKDGALVDVEVLGLPVVVAGERVGNVIIYHDITELLHAQRAAEEANQAKSAFLAMMSHEIRTPMNAVIGMSGLLIDTGLSGEQREYAEIVRNSADALLTIINDILDFSKIEAGKMDLDFQPFELRECAESALDLTAGRAAEKGLDLAYLMDEEVPAALVGDGPRLRQILINLLNNAVKFTETGEVVLSVGATRLSGPVLDERTTLAERYELHFAVRDTGLGIPPERMDRLFQSFSQVDTSTARKYGGTGLGLAISRRLVELMGGRMWAESAGVPGQGSTFHFTIVAETVPALGSHRPELRTVQPQLEDRKVLVVDDNATNRRILVLQTRAWGMQPEETASPREALEWIRAGRAFDVGILDMNMPEMDGVALAKEMRRLRPAEALPLILFTSLGRREAGAEEVGFAAHLSKPIKPSLLFDALAGIFVQRADGGAGTNAQPRAAAPRAKLDPEMASQHPLRILLAEDNAVNQMLALRMLQQLGYRADTAGNGLEAIEAIERQAYDLVFMDVQMPEMDGLEATREIVRRWGPGQRPRIAAMTANAMQGDREMCLAAGMDDYVTKPLRPEELIAALWRAHMRTIESAATDAPPALDPATLQALVDTTDAEFARELVAAYLEDAPAQLAALRAHLAAGQPDDFRRAAHSLKSSSASVGAPVVSAAAKELEQMAKSGAEAMAATGPHLARLEAEYRRAEQALRAWANEAAA